MRLPFRCSSVFHPVRNQRTFLSQLIDVLSSFSSSLIFAKPNLGSFDFFNLIWAVGITDFVLKYFTIGLKCFVLFLPKILLAFKSRVRPPHGFL